MEELIQRITAATGLDAGVAQQAIGTILGFIKKHAPDGPMSELLNSIPGGEAAVAADAAAPASGGGLMGAVGGLLGGLGGAAGGAGGLMALAGQLSSKGLDMGQIKTVGQEILKFGGEQIGPDKIKEIVQNIPGMSSMV